MKVAIIGARAGRFGLGSATLQEFSRHGHSVKAFSRSDCNINDPNWCEVLKDSYDVIILNAFDRENPMVQLQAFKQLYERYQHDSRTQLVAIGSMAHYFKIETPYEKAKFSLNQFLMRVGKNSLGYECKLCLFEPGSMDSIVPHVTYPMTYSTSEETAQVLRTSVEMNLKFLHVAMRGNRKAHIGE